MKTKVFSYNRSQTTGSIWEYFAARSAFARSEKFSQEKCFEGGGRSIVQQHRRSHHLAEVDSTSNDSS